MVDTYIKTLNKSINLFIDLAKLKEHRNKKHYFALAIITNSWILLEAYTNYIGQIFSKAKLKPHEKALLLDQEIRLNDNGNFIEGRSKIATLKRILFILNMFSNVNVKKFKNSKEWNRIQNCGELRDRLIHPKKIDVHNKINIKKAEKFHEEIVSFIQFLNKKLMKKPIILI